jgi:hypothetical protein
MKNKQTAVEWLEQEFIALQNYGVNELGLFIKAKQLEHIQIIEAQISILKKAPYGGYDLLTKYLKEQLLELRNKKNK